MRRNYLLTLVEVALRRHWIVSRWNETPHPPPCGPPAPQTRGLSFKNAAFYFCILPFALCLLTCFTASTCRFSGRNRTPLPPPCGPPSPHGRGPLWAIP